MIRGRRALAVALLAMTMPALVMAERAWACVTLPEVTVLPTSSAPAGHTFTVQGANFAGPV